MVLRVLSFQLLDPAKRVRFAPEDPDAVPAVILPLSVSRRDTMDRLSPRARAEEENRLPALIYPQSQPQRAGLRVPRLHGQPLVDPGFDEQRSRIHLRRPVERDAHQAADAEGHDPPARSQCSERILVSSQAVVEPAHLLDLTAGLSETVLKLFDTLTPLRRLDLHARILSCPWYTRPHLFINRRVRTHGPANLSAK